MIIQIAAITQETQTATLKDMLAQLDWRDGRETAGAIAKRVKRNLQAIMKTQAGRAIRDELQPVIEANRVLKAAARPRRFSPLLISKTANGGFYGPHVDNSLMGKAPNRLRTDVSFTLFLSDPSDYEGGELVVYNAGVAQTIKAPWGHMVLYPSTSIHEVKPVTSGERIVCVGWIESLIADPVQRELLFDMENLRTSLRETLKAQSPELLTLDKTMANLVRMWSQP